MFTQSSSIIITSSPETIWKLLTDPAVVNQYFPDIKLKIDRYVGGEILFMRDREGKSYTDKGIITEITPNESLTYNYRSFWSALPDVPESYFPVSYSLEVLPKTQTKVTISQSAETQVKADEAAKNWVETLTRIKAILDSSSDLNFFTVFSSLML